MSSARPTDRRRRGGSAGGAAWVGAGCALLMIAQQVAGKATRDALFLSTHGVGLLPTMFIVAAVMSIGLVPICSRLLGRHGPMRVVPPAFAASGAVLVGWWLLAGVSPAAAGIALYLHIAAINAILISWFWSLISERFDPRTARLEMRRMVSGAALGGLVGGLLAERGAVVVGVRPMLLVLAALHVLCALTSRKLARPGAHVAAHAPAEPWLTVLRRSSYVRHLALLVVASTVTSTLIDFVFKSAAVESYSRGPSLLRFFAVFYAVTGLATFLVESLLARVALARLGIARTVATLPVAIVAGGVASLAAPGLATAALLRGVETTLHGSLYRSGYELFFTPLPPGEKRSVKTMIDVGFDRLGDGLGGGLLAISVPLLGASPRPWLLGIALAMSIVVVWVTLRPHGGYVKTLARSLRERAVALEVADVHDSTTMSVLRSVIVDTRKVRGASASSPLPAVAPPDPLADLRSGDAPRVKRSLEEQPLAGPAVPVAIGLLAWDPVAPAALAALRRVANENLEPLIQALLSPDEEEFTVRRRIPRVLEASDDPRVIDALLTGLEDSRFEVRYRCGRALSRIYARSGTVEIDRERVLAAVLRATAQGRGVWESQRLLDSDEDGDAAGPEDEELDELLRERASRSLQHVFTLLALAFPRRPMLIAFRGLHTDDETLRGTALEYLESALPADIRAALWPYLEDRRPLERRGRPREQILDELLVSNRSIQLNLQELRRIRAREG